MHKTAVLGLAGEFLSGKSTAAAFYVQKFGAKKLRFSTVLDDILGILALPITRDNEQKLALCLREVFGEAVIAETLVKSVESSKRGVFIVDGLRKYEEITVLKRLPNFKLIYIESSLQKRFARLQGRDEKQGEKILTLEQFAKSHEHESDKDVPKLKQYANFVIDNDGTQEALEQKLTQALTESL